MIILTDYIKDYIIYGMHDAGASESARTVPGDSFLTASVVAIIM